MSAQTSSAKRIVRSFSRSASSFTVKPRGTIDAEPAYVAHSATNYQITRLPNYQIHCPYHFHCRRGFTLIELMVVMSLLVVLSTLGLVGYRQSVTRSKEAVLKEDLFRLRDAIDQFYADKNKYPPMLEDLVTDGYLRMMPKDPFTDSTTTWQAVPAEPDPASPAAEPGVFDVKSGSQATALDGSRYAEW
jgi:general secretion pathway protein G